MGKLCLCVVIALSAATGVCAQSATVLVVYKNGSSVDQVDPLTGATLASTPLTVVGGGTIHGFNGMTQDPTTGTLYGAVRLAASPTHDYSLCTIDRLAGTITVRGAFGNSVADIQFDEAGTLFAVTGDDGTPAQTLFSVNKFTGAMTQLYALSNGGAGESLGFDRAEAGFMRHWSGTGSTAQGSVYEYVQLSTGTLSPFSITGVSAGVTLLSMSYDSQTTSFWVGTNTGVLGLLGLNTFTPLGTLAGEAEGMVRLPRVNPQTSSIYLGTVTQGNAGAPEMFLVNGFNLFTVGEITAPPGIQISFSDTTGFDTTLYPSPNPNGSLGNTAVYVRIADYAQPGPINDVLTLTSLGGDVLTVALSGQVDPSVVMPEMDVLNAQSLPVVSGSVEPGGTVSTTGTIHATYTIENNGNFILELTSQDAIEVTPGSNVVIVFVTTPGIFIAASAFATFDIEFAVLTTGPFDFTISIPNTDPDENPYTWQVAGDAVGPEIEVVRGTTVVTPPGPEALPAQTTAPSTLTYSIMNVGAETLNISGASVAFELNCAVTVTIPPGATVGPSGTTTMEITVDPIAPGAFEFAVLINSNDADESIFAIYSVGTATAAPDNSDDGDGGSEETGCTTRPGLPVLLACLGALAAAMIGLRLRATGA